MASEYSGQPTAAAAREEMKLKAGANWPAASSLPIALGVGGQYLAYLQAEMARLRTTERPSSVRKLFSHSALDTLCLLSQLARGAPSYALGPTLLTSYNNCCSHGSYKEWMG